MATDIEFRRCMTIRDVRFSLIFSDTFSSHDLNATSKHRFPHRKMTFLHTVFKFPIALDASIHRDMAVLR